jgi:ankyrin repeat protein
VVDAVLAGDIQRLSGLLNGGADPNTIDTSLSSTPLSIAAMSTCAAAVRLLLDADADPNLIAEGGEAPLTFAANVGDIDIVTMLLAGGADPSRTGGYDGLTPMHEAVGVGRATVVRLMLPHASDIDAGIVPEANPLAGEDVGVGTVLEFAVGIENRESYVRLLLEAGATPTITALYRAVRIGSAESVTRLLDAGAPMTLSPNETRTMTQVAIDFGHPELTRILEAR